MKIGFYPGSFDPVTNGHVDIFERSAALVDRLIVGIGIHPGKTPKFSVQEKTEMLKTVLEPFAKRDSFEFEIVTFDGLVVDAASTHGASILIRGLRDPADFTYEMQMSGMNGAMKPEVHTVFLPASPGVQHISSTLVRQIASMGGNVQTFVPNHVADMLREKFTG